MKKEVQSKINCIKIPKKLCSVIKKKLKKYDVFNRDYKPKSEGDYTIFAIVKSVDLEALGIGKAEYEVRLESDFERRVRGSGKSFSTELRTFLNDKEIQKISTFSVIGSILIFESLDPNIQLKEKKIGEAYLKTIDKVKTVVKKEGMCENEFRIQETFQTVHKEHGRLFHVNINEVFFSYKMAEERKRIGLMCKEDNDKKVFCPFSGICPFPIICVHMHPKIEKVVCVELNEKSVKYGRLNVKANKMENKIEVFNQDLLEYIQEVKEFDFDRVVFPMPRIKGISDFFLLQKFLYPIVSVCKLGTKFNVYVHVLEDEIEKFLKNLENDVIKTIKKKIKIDKYQKVGKQQKYKFYRYCVDLLVINQ